VALQFFQEIRANTAAEKLQAMVSNTATLVRGGIDLEAALKMVVPAILSGWPPAIWCGLMPGFF